MSVTAPRHLALVLLAATAVFGGACGSQGPANHPDADDDGDASMDASLESQPDRAAPDAPADTHDAPDLGAPPDAGAPHPDAPPQDARSDVAKDLAATPVMPLGACGVGTGTTCPATYLGTLAIADTSSWVVTAALAPDDTLFIGGQFTTATDFDPTVGTDLRTPDDGHSAFLTTIGPDGAYVRTATFPDDGAWGASVGAVAATATSVIALGTFDGTTDLNPGPAVDQHDGTNAGALFAVKLTSAGAFVWSRVFQSSTDGGLLGMSGLATASDGSSFIVGSYNGPVDFDPGPASRPAPNAKGSYLTRLNEFGNLAWVRTLGGDDACQTLWVSAVVLGADGAPWLTGFFDGACAFDQGGPATPAGQHGMFITSLSAAGQVRALWTVTGNVNPIAMSAAPDGSIFIGGNASPSVPHQPAVVDFDPSSAVAATTLTDDTPGAFMLKLGAAGEFRWVQLLALEGFSMSIGATADDGVLVADGPDRPAGVVLLELDAAGKESWRMFTGGAGTSVNNLLVGTKGFVLVGTQGSPSDLDPSTSVDRFDQRIWFASRYAF